jgi:UDP-glucose 4-epimerase
MSDPHGAVLVTGAAGYVGRLAVLALADHKAKGAAIGPIVATDIRQPADADRREGVSWRVADVRGPELGDVMAEFAVQTVVHLAAMVSPGKKPDRELEYSVDVLGTKNVLECCLATGVKKVIVTSSGAAYGYYADSPEWLDEDDALRGNVEFAYSDHKRQVEEMLAVWRDEHPELEQLILRPGTILGESVRNQITDLFDARAVIGLRGAAIPFVLIWDRDVVGCIVRGVSTDATGIYNLAGDGVITMREMARRMGKPYLPLPVRPTRGALWLMKKLGRTQYGPEQLDFLRYRPVLSNRRLKEEFGYVPMKTTEQVFDLFVQSRQAETGADS